MNLFDVTYLVTNIFSTYIIYKLMYVFFDDRKTSKYIELGTYALYYALSSFAFLYNPVPVFMLILNVTLLLALTFNYQSSIKRKVIFSFVSYMIMMCIEVLVGVLTGYTQILLFEKSEFASEIGLVVIRVISILVVIALSNLKNLKNNVPVPNFYWFSTVFVSFATIYIFILLLSNNNFSQAMVLILTCLILCIDFIILFLYDNLCKAFSLKTEKLLLEQQNKMYHNQLELIQQSVKSTQIVRHDMKNHMIALKNLCLESGCEKVEKYVDSMFLEVDEVKAFSCSGNFVFDSIVNFKMQLLLNMKVDICIDIQIPETLHIADYDLTVVIGNLMDNAVEALKKCPDSSREFKFKAFYEKGNLIIVIVNSHVGHIEEKNGEFISTKKNSWDHGIGTKSVKNAVERNQGAVFYEYDECYFKAQVVLSA